MNKIENVRSKAALVYEALHSAILQSELKPGARLVINDLAAELGVSPIPVREALRQLEVDGFITFQPYIGVTVTEIKASSISEIFGLLEAMELLSGQAACQRMTDTDDVALEQLLHRMDTLVSEPAEWSRENVHFHQLVCDLADMPLVRHIMNKTLQHWDRVRSYYLKDVFAFRIAVAQREHWRIFEAMRARDLGLLEKVVHDHNQAALVAYLQHLQSSNQPNRE
ncbi:MAG: GntR family transcriptional regulator [Chloroflexota bacterium]